MGRPGLGGCKNAYFGTLMPFLRGLNRFRMRVSLRQRRCRWADHAICFKRLGERVTARTFDRQVVELHVRVALLNRFSQIGRPQTTPVATVA